MKLNKKQIAFCELHKITKEQFFGETPINGVFELSAGEIVPSGFSPHVLGNVYIAGPGVNFPTNFTIVVGGSFIGRYVREIPDNFCAIAGGSLNLGNATQIGSGFVGIAGQSICLLMLRAMPPDALLFAGTHIDLGGLVKTPPGFTPVCEQLQLNCVRQFGDGFFPIISELLTIVETSGLSIPTGFYMYSETPDGWELKPVVPYNLSKHAWRYKNFLLHDQTVYIIYSEEDARVGHEMVKTVHARPVNGDTSREVVFKSTVLDPRLIPAGLTLSSLKDIAKKIQDILDTTTQEYKNVIKQIKDYKLW